MSTFEEILFPPEIHSGAFIWVQKRSMKLFFILGLRIKSLKYNNLLMA